MPPRESALGQHLSVSRLLASGESAPIVFAIGTSSGSRQVPVPDMLWPTLAEMVGIAIFTGCRRRQDRPLARMVV